VGLLRLTAPPEPTIHTVVGVQTVANGPDGAYSGDGNLAVDAGLSRPSDVVAGSDGSVYIADFGNLAIRQVVGGVIQTVAGRGTAPLVDGAVAIEVALQTPSSLALDSAGHLYFLEARNDALEVWTLQDTKLSRVALLGRSRPVSSGSHKVPIGGIAIAGDGAMYIADWAENHIWRQTRGGTPSIYAGTGAPGCSGDHGAATEATLRGPMGLALDPSGNLYIADTGNNTIRKVDTQGIITTIAGRSGYCDLYADSGDGGPATQARLSFPFGVALGKDGTVYIADTGNNRIREITPSGTILPVAGTGLLGFGGDGGLAIDANLVAPEAVWLEPNGHLLIADSGDHRIREVRGLPG
jgi:sugar lactone lactonase YvrE